MDSVIQRFSYSELVCTLDVFRIPCRLVIVANSERHSNKYLADTCIGNPVTQYYVHVVIYPHSPTPFFFIIYFFVINNGVPSRYSVFFCRFGNAYKHYLDY